MTARTRWGGPQNPFSAGSWGGPTRSEPKRTTKSPIFFYFFFFANSSCRMTHSKSMQQQGRADSPAPGLLNPPQKSWCLTCPCVCTQIPVSFNTAVPPPLHLLQNILRPGGRGTKKPGFFSYMFYKANGWWINNSGFFPCYS